MSEENQDNYAESVQRLYRTLSNYAKMATGEETTIFDDPHFKQLSLDFLTLSLNTITTEARLDEQRTANERTRQAVSRTSPQRQLGEVES